MAPTPEDDYERGRLAGQRDAGLQQMRAELEAVSKRLENVEREMTKLSKDFGEFRAVALAAAAAAVTNKTFWLGVAGIAVAVFVALGIKP
jgi:DNA repair exonuclease SbcCD ATPase subunit